MNKSDGANRVNKDFIKNGASSVGGDDVKRLLEQEDDVMSKLTGKLAQFAESIKMLFSLMKDYFSGAYRDTPWWVISAAAFSLIYFLNPLDIVPDAIPFIGLLDDAAVIAICLDLIKFDLRKYKDWLEKRNSGKATKKCLNHVK